MKSILDTLTPREREVLFLLNQGMSNKAMGKVLEIAFRTVETHRAHIYTKLGVHNAVELNNLVRDEHEQQLAALRRKGDRGAALLALRARSLRNFGQNAHQGADVALGGQAVEANSVHTDAPAVLQPGEQSHSTSLPTEQAHEQSASTMKNAAHRRAAWRRTVRSRALPALRTLQRRCPRCQHMEIREIKP